MRLAASGVRGCSPPPLIGGLPGFCLPQDAGLRGLCLPQKASLCVSCLAVGGFFMLVPGCRRARAPYHTIHAGSHRPVIVCLSRLRICPPIYMISLAPLALYPRPSAASCLRALPSFVLPLSCSCSLRCPSGFSSFLALTGLVPFSLQGIQSIGSLGLFFEDRVVWRWARTPRSPFG